MRKFRPDVFLYRMLAVIFATEAGFLAFAFWKCSLPIPGTPVPLVTERCPKLGERAETLFVAAVATTLSLLTGAVALQSPRSSSVDPDASASLPRRPSATGSVPGPASRKES